MADVQTLAHGILTTYASVANHMLELHVAPPCFTTDPSEKPRASSYARLQAESGSKVTNLRHEMVDIEAEFDRQLLRLLDGTRSRAELLEALADSVAAGALVISQDGQVIEDRTQVTELFASALDRQLKELAKNALIVA